VKTFTKRLLTNETHQTQATESGHMTTTSSVPCLYQRLSWCSKHCQSPSCAHTGTQCQPAQSRFLKQSELNAWPRKLTILKTEIFSSEGVELVTPLDLLISKKLSPILEPSLSHLHVSHLGWDRSWVSPVEGLKTCYTVAQSWKGYRDAAKKLWRAWLWFFLVTPNPDRQPTLHAIVRMTGFSSSFNFTKPSSTSPTLQTHEVPQKVHELHESPKWSQTPGTCAEVLYWADSGPKEWKQKKFKTKEKRKRKEKDTSTVFLTNSRTWSPADWKHSAVPNDQTKVVTFSELHSCGSTENVEPVPHWHHQFLPSPVHSPPVLFFPPRNTHVVVYYESIKREVKTKDTMYIWVSVWWKTTN
jgi:hypothetical protein